MKRTSLLLAMGLLGNACFAQTATDLSACTPIADEKARLKCYDERMARAGHPVAAAKAPKPAANTFGLEPKAVEKREPEEFTGRVKSVSTRPHGEYRIELDDGQVWVETLRTGGQPPAAGETVTIKRGSLGSFYMARGAGVALRVKRVQ